MNESSVAEYYDDVTPEGLAGVLVGRRIVKVDSRRGMVILDDGTELEFEDTADCCAWYDVAIEPHMDYADNVITRVVVLDEPAFKPFRADPEYEDVYTIRVLGRDKAILDVNVEGDPTSGYYCHSFNLNVRRIPQTAKGREVMIRDMPEPRDGRVHFYRDADDRLFVSQMSLADQSTRVWAFLGGLGRDEFNVGFPGWVSRVSIARLVAFPLVEVEVVDKEKTE